MGGDPPRPTPSPPVERAALVDALRAFLPAIRHADLASPSVARAALESRFPAAGAEAARIEALARKGVEAGWLLDRSAGPRVRFGRLERDLDGFSVDFVLMEGPAAGHTHPNGEVNLGWRWSGAPKFDGHPPGWVVFPPGSHHVPTVTGGEMLLLYFLPGGKVAWDPPQKRA